MQQLEYEWDEAMRRSNLAKHGVDFDAVQQFDWDTAYESLGARRAYGESRWKAIGLIIGRLHVLIFTRRGRGTRIISLRKASNKKMDEYEATS